jgi:hypothetical protein
MANIQGRTVSHLDGKSLKHKGESIAANLCVCGIEVAPQDGLIQPVQHGIDGGSGLFLVKATQDSHKVHMQLCGACHYCSLHEHLNAVLLKDESIFFTAELPSLDQDFTCSPPNVRCDRAGTLYRAAYETLVTRQTLLSPEGLHCIDSNHRAAKVTP